MHSNKDSEIARLVDVVASLAQQMATLAPFVAANVGNNTQASDPVPVTTPTAPAAHVAPVSHVAPAPLPSTSSAAISQQTLVNQEIQEEQGTGAHRRWYVVVIGLQVGVFRGWTNTAPLVLGVTGSIFNREPTREAAIVAFNAAAASGQVRIID